MQDNAIEELQQFGLSAYAARAYLALLELGIAEARGVSELARIPTAKVYATLAQLERRGLATVTPGKPRRYAPVPIEEFVERQIQEEEEHTGDLRARKALLVAMFPIVGTASLHQRPHTVTVTGRRNILQHLRDACSKTRSDIFVMMTPSLRRDAATRRAFARASTRGVAIHLVEADEAADDRLLSRGFPHLHFEKGPSRTMPLLATFDDDVAILAHLDEEPSSRARREEVAIHTTDAGFVKPLRRILALQHALRGQVARGQASAGASDTLVERQARDRRHA